MKPSSAIRLLGETHTAHPRDAILAVTDNEALARSNAEVITLERARELVAKGMAEWVGAPPAEEKPAAKNGKPASAPASKTSRSHDD